MNKQINKWNIAKHKEELEIKYNSRNDNFQ